MEITNTQIAERVTLEDDTFQDKALFICRVGTMILEQGTGAWRVKTAIHKLAAILGLTCAADIGLLNFNYVCRSKKASYVDICTLKNPHINMDKLEALENLVMHFEEYAHKYTLPELNALLETIEALPAKYSETQLVLAAGCACACFAFLLGGGLVEMFLTFWGGVTGYLCRYELIRRKVTFIINVAAASIVSCSTYALLFKLSEQFLHISAVHEVGYICSMLYLIPGFPLVSGIRDIVKLELRSGLERTIYACIIISITTLTGCLTAAYLHMEPGSFVEPQFTQPMLMVLRMLCSFLAVYCFSFFFNSRRQVAIWAGSIALMANTCRFCLLDYAHTHIAVAAFGGALVAGVLASLIYKRIHCPRVALTVPAIVIMIPGLLLYKSVFYIVTNQIHTGSILLIQALLIIFAIPIGLVVARTLTETAFRRDN